MTLTYKPFKELLYLILGDNPDPTILLALFHTGFNVVLALIWAPLLNPLMRFLQWLFPRQHTDLHLAIEHVNTTLPEEIITALHKDTIMLIEKTITYNRASIMLDGSIYRKRGELYNELKQIEEKLLEFVIYYTKFEFSAQQANSLHLLHDAIMDAISSSKYIKDVSHHLDEIKDNSLENIMAQSYSFFQKIINNSTETIHNWQNIAPTMEVRLLEDNVHNTIQSLHSDDDLFIGSLSANMKQEHSDDINIAEVLKSNRYILLSCESLLHGYLKRSQSTTTHL